MEERYRLRPHHGMCIAFFKGKGYSSEFTAHMSSVIEKLEQNPQICLTSQTDVICSKCPNNQQGICETEDKAAEYDRQVEKRCGWSEGTVLSYAEFRNTVEEKILRTGKREEICGNCQWNTLCHF